MCGICGVYSTTLSLGEKELFKKLLLLNVFRGSHSTGVIKSRGSQKKSTTTLKAVMPSPEFVFNKKGADFIDDRDDKGNTGSITTLVGHCRHATQGAVTPQNAHPFSFENVSGVHNGTINGKFEGRDDYETDSEALYALIDQQGIEKALNEIANAGPAYALAYVDKREGSLNFVRNSKRPLFFTFGFGRTTLIWSSTKESIEYAVENTSMQINLTGWDTKDSKETYFYLPENALLTIKLGSSATTAKLRQLDVKAPTSVVYNYSGKSSVWVKGSDGQYRSKDDEDKRLALLEESWESVLKKSDEVIATSDTSNKALAVITEAPPEVGGKYGNFRSNHADLSSLPWLRDTVHKSSTPSSDGTTDGKTDPAADGRSVKEGSSKPATTPAIGTEPLSQSERNYKLSCGCFACGNAVAPNDFSEVARVRWWTRDHYACGDCYETSEGDWVKHTIDGTYDADIRTIN